MYCWDCGKNTMALREDKAYLECPCGATENVGGASTTEAAQAKLAAKAKSGGKKK